MTIHPYFTAKARQVFGEAGGDPANAEPLAIWAQAARVNPNAADGVIVAEDGTILAKTRHQPATPTSPGVTYVIDDGRWNLWGNELGLAMGQIARQSGQQCIHVTYSKVCTGAAEFIPARYRSEAS